MKEPLASLGYTTREASFLRVASLLSGYFLRRHFNQFNDKESGAVAQRFIERALGMGHIRAIPALGGRVIYHAATSFLYAALGDPDNRNRREHRPETVRARLMALDFAILNPQANWLLTDKAKMDCFLALGIEAGNLPRFVEKQPIFLTSGPQFAFIDSGLRTLSHWDLFLKSHRTLLQRLPSADVIFASSQATRSDSAEKAFRKAIAGESSAGGLDTERVSRYFAARKAFEEKRYQDFDQGRLDELRENKQVFSGEQFERLYSQWRANGNLAIGGLQSSRVNFRFQALPHIYEWLSPI